MRASVILGAFCAVVLGALWFLYDPKNPSYGSSVLLSLMTGFLAGAVTPILIYLISGKTAQDIISAEFSAILNRIYSDYAPQKTYPPSKALNDDFNIDLTQALSRTRHYTFVGETGVHVPARICRREEAVGVLNSVEVVLAFSRSAAILDRDYAIPGTSLTAIRRVSILAAVMALREVAQSNPVRTITLYLLKDGLGFRFEATDEATFLTESPNSFAVGSYPPSYKVEKDSILGRISANTLTVAKATATKIDLNTVSEDDLISGIGFEVTPEQRSAAEELKEKLKVLKHA